MPFPRKYSSHPPNKVTTILVGFIQIYLQHVFWCTHVCFPRGLYLGVKLLDHECRKHSAPEDTAEVAPVTFLPAVQSIPVVLCLLTCAIVSQSHYFLTTIHKFRAVEIISKGSNSSFLPLIIIMLTFFFWLRLDFESEGTVKPSMVKQLNSNPQAWGRVLMLGFHQKDHSVASE